MGNSDTSFTIALATGWSFTNDFFVVVDRGLATEEKIECSSISGLVVSVANRGADGTSAVAHAAGCTVQVCHVAQDDDEANQVVAAVLGQSGAAKGDILAMLSAAGPNTLTRVGIGSTGGVLSVASGLPAWVAPPAHSSSTPSNPTGTTSSAMMGLAGSITPAATGKVRITIDGVYTTSSSNPAVQSMTITMKTGTGTAPSNGAAATGTSQGAGVGGLNAIGANQAFSISRTVTGLTLATAYWIDVLIATAGTGTSSILDVTITADELL